MSTPSKNNAAATPNDVASKAEEKKTVPAQNTPETESTTDEKQKLTVIEGEKKSLKERVESVTHKLKANKKSFAVVAVASSIATVAFTQLLKQLTKQSEEVQVEVVEYEETEPSDESAA